MNISYKKILEKKDYLPFYIYDYETIKGQILKLKKYLPENVKVYYSVKANPNVAILKIMKNFEVGAEILSLGELEACRMAEMKPDKIIFAGSTKSDEEFLAAVKINAGLISVESDSEIERLNKIVKRLGKKACTLLRVSLKSVSGSALDNYSVFNYGFPRNKAKTFFKKKFKSFFNLDFKGIHVYDKNRIYNTDDLIRKTDEIFSFVKKLEKRRCLSFEVVDIGGGFGADTSKELPAADFCQKLKKLIEKYNFGRKQIILELGRYFTAKAGVYVTRIIEERKQNNINFLVVESIVNHLNRAFVDSEIKQRFLTNIKEIKANILPKRGGEPLSYVISGQMSSLSDVFGRTYKCFFDFPQPRPGDFLIISGVGAYGLNQGLVLFGSRPIASEFLLINGKLELVKNTIGPKDLLSYQRIPFVLNKKLNHDKK